MVQNAIYQILQENLDREISNSVYLNDYCEVEKNEVEEDDKDIYNILKLNPEENDIGGPGYPKE